MIRVTIDTDDISDWNSFHDLFASKFGFPEYYGRTMDAWIDCMTSLDSPDEGMTTIHVDSGQVIVLDLGELGDFAGRCPEIYEALVDCIAFVNYRRMQVGDAPVLTLAFSK